MHSSKDQGTWRPWLCTKFVMHGDRDKKALARKKDQKGKQRYSGKQRRALRLVEIRLGGVGEKKHKKRN